MCVRERIDGLMISESSSTESLSGSDSSIRSSLSCASRGDQSECESRCEAFEFSGEDLIRLNEDDQVFRVIEHKFTSGFSPDAADIVAIHKNPYSNPSSKGRLRAFQAFSHTMEEKNKQNINMKYAWYPTSKNAIGEIISHGFGGPRGAGLYGYAVHLFPLRHVVNSARSSIIDQQGLRHVFLCRVLVGKTERITAGSHQWHPNSEEFDSGVDDLNSPSIYIIWNINLNTHVLPDYVVSFRISGGCSLMADRIGTRPTSSWVPIPALLSALSRNLPPISLVSATKYFREFKARKISRQQLVRRIRDIAGDELLMEIIRSSGLKKPTTP